MTYSAPGAGPFAKRKGTLSEKLNYELGLIETELSSIETEAGIQDSDFVVLTAGQGTITALATTGIDLADGTGATLYGVFFAPVAITVKKMHVLFTEAYVKEDDDASIVLQDNAETPNTIFTYTPAAAGVAEGTQVSDDPETGEADLAAGTRLDMVISATKSSSGTGHAVVILEYEENHS